MTELETVTRSAEETRAVAKDFGEDLALDDTVLLFGELGSGKTVFTQGVATALGLDAGMVQSPTYTLIHEYRPGERLDTPVTDPLMVHVDLYRLSPEEVESTGVDEALTGPGVKIVEWADRLPWRPNDAWMISIDQVAGGQRRIRIRRGSR